MIIQSVTPDNGSAEGKWIALIIGCILLIAVVALPYHQSNDEGVKLELHQVLITDLAQDDLAMIAELRLAYEEIYDIQAESTEENAWPEIAYLADEWLPPFVQDQSWERRGKHQWQHLGSGVYLGLKVKKEGAASFIFNVKGDDIELWLHPELMSTSISSDSISWNESELIQQHWMQVVFPAHDIHLN